MVKFVSMFDFLRRLKFEIDRAFGVIWRGGRAIYKMEIVQIRMCLYPKNVTFDCLIIIFYDFRIISALIFNILLCTYVPRGH